MTEAKTIMRPLTIDDAVKAEIAALIERAEASPVPLDVMRERVEAFNRGEYMPTINPDMAINVPSGFLVTYEHEYHSLGKMRHLSVSLDAADKVPNTEAVAMLMHEFHFINVLQDCVVYVLPCEDGVQAVHVVEPIDGNMQALSARPKAANDRD